MYGEPSPNSMVSVVKGVACSIRDIEIGRQGLLGECADLLCGFFEGSHTNAEQR